MKPKRRNRMTWREASIVTDPLRRALMMLRSGEIDAIDGYPAFLDWQGIWSRIDEALNGWISCWERFNAGIDLTALKILMVKLAEDKPLTIQEIDSALSTLRLQEKMLTRLPSDFIFSQTMTERIEIEMQDLGIKEAA